MKIYSVFDPEFKPYGQIVTGMDQTVQEILAALATTPLQKTEGFLSIFLAWICSAVFLGISDKLLDFMGEKGTLALTRLMGTLLILLAVQMLLNGITEYIRHLPATL